MTNDAGRRQERREALFGSTLDGDCCAACRMAREVLRKFLGADYAKSAHNDIVSSIRR
jgi:hypothetical protein